MPIIRFLKHDVYKQINLLWYTIKSLRIAIEAIESVIRMLLII